MKKIVSVLIDRRYIVLAVMLVIATLCGALVFAVPVNLDRSKYLADDSNMKEGMSIMDSAFPELEEKSSIRVMFSDLTAEQTADVLARLKAIPNVSSVTYDAESEDYNKENRTLFVVNTKFEYFTEEEKAIENAIEKGFPEYEMTYKNNDLPTTEVPIWLLASAVVMAVVILLFLCESWLEPFLYLLTLGIGVVINFGTNIVLPYIDEMTLTIGPILQLVLSMDYSLMLMSRYRQEKAHCQSKTDAMKAALAGSVSSIASSAFTTVVGLLSLVFLSFKLGPELGIVLAKGVAVGMLCVFTLLPTFILMADKWLEKTVKKALHVKIDGLAKYSYKARRFMPLVFVLLLVGSFILQSFTAITFTEKIDDPLAEVFPKDNTLALIYSTADEAKIDEIILALEQDGRVKSVLGYTNTLGKEMNAGEMSRALAALGGELPLDETLLRMLYYLEAGGVAPTVTAGELFSFLLEKVIPNPRLSGYLDQSVLENAAYLGKFTSKELLTKEISSSEMAEFLGAEQEGLEQLYLYYFMQNGVENSGEMTVSAFVDFLLNTVAKDELYGTMLDAEVQKNLTRLEIFTKTENLETQYTAADLASLLGESETLVRTVFFLSGLRQTMSPEEFVSAVLSNVLFTGTMDKETLAQLQTLQKVIDATKHKASLNSAEMAAILGIEQAQAEQLYVLRLYQTAPTEWKLSPHRFISFVATKVLGDPAFVGMIDQKTAADLQTAHTLTSAVLSDKAYTKEEMTALLSTFTEGVSAEQTEVLYLLYGGSQISDGSTMTVVSLFDFISDSFLQDPRFADLLDEQAKAEIPAGKAKLGDAIAQLKGDTYSRLVITSDYPDESPETLAFVTNLGALCESRLDTYYLVGNSAMVSEIEETFRQEYLMITLITALSIFVVVLFAFRRPILPLLLTLVVQCGVFITVTALGIYSGSIFYLALLVVQSILMGATIDYGIVFCNAYRESRPHTDAFGALRKAYESSMHTVLASGSILIIVDAILGIFAPSKTISQVCATLAVGVLVAVLLILFLFPGLVICCDKFIHRQKNASPSP